MRMRQEIDMDSLWQELEQYSESDYYPFHMPGHKRSGWPYHKRSGWPVSALYRYDITEIEGFDNLHDAKGLLLSLQRRAARVYHAEESFFLVNGSTGGILSAVSAAAREGKKLLMARNCHKSVYNAVLLNRLEAEYLWPETIEEFDIQGEISAAQIEKHLEGRQDICGVVITSPTYDGIISDIRAIVEAVHACGVPLIVDEAHGAHFALSDRAPKSAVECGADIVINSVHKTLPALTQTALLHVQGTLVDRERLKDYLRIYQSSSPSYLLMASIDACVRYIECEGKKSYGRLLAFREQIDKKAAEFSHIRILPQGEDRDPGKLVISVKNTNMSGRELYQILLQKYHLQMEMASVSCAVGILTGMDTQEGVERLIRALAEVDKGLEKEEGAAGAYDIKPAFSGLCIYEAAAEKKEWVLPEEAAGRVSGGFLYFYPPGIPLLVPGEMIGEKQILLMRECRERKEYLTGISDDGKICVLTGNMHSGRK